MSWDNTRLFSVPFFKVLHLRYFPHKSFPIISTFDKSPYQNIPWQWVIMYHHGNIASQPHNQGPVVGRMGTAWQS